MKIIRFLPNLLTLLNLFCGCMAMSYAFQNQLKQTIVFVFLGVFFDFFDGFVARILHVQSELGKQLDSLADMVTSGVVPGIVMCQILSFVYNDQPFDVSDGIGVSVLGFLIPLASCYRLAVFNLDENQKDGFIGLPTPANTILILSLAWIFNAGTAALWAFLMQSIYFWVGITLLSCFLLNAPIKLLALKFKSYGVKDNLEKYILSIVALVIFSLYRISGIPLVILFYIIWSFLCSKKKKS